MEKSNFIQIIKKFTNLFLYVFIIDILKNKYLKKPKVSVFLPIYNKESYIRRSINSIQKQTLKNIEIVAVNDFSTDKTLQILKKLVKKDKRIKIINNDRNHGLLYSRAMGILNSTGEFVMNLDPDDKLSDQNNLKILYYKSKIFRLDIITYLISKVKAPNNTFINIFIKKLRKNNFKSFNKHPRFEYPMITNKFIKKIVIRKALNFFKTKIFANKWNYHEDNIWNILINKYSNRKIYFNKYIYLYFVYNTSLMRNRRNLLEINNYIYRFEMFEKIYQDNKKKILSFLKTLFRIVNNRSLKINIDIEIKKKIFRLLYKYNNYYHNNNKTQI